MKRLLTVVAAYCVIFVAPQAFASDSASQSRPAKWQMISQIAGCMKKRMSADRNSSYREAMKICKDEINNERDISPSGPLVASESQAKP
jgi:hypothetical protein